MQTEEETSEREKRVLPSNPSAQSSESGAVHIDENEDSSVGREDSGDTKQNKKLTKPEKNHSGKIAHDGAT